MQCLEYDLSDEEALLWLIQRHQRSDGLNDFCRIRLALELEPWFKQRAKSNQQAGGQHKGSSNLTKAERVDVRSEIAATAGVSTGNVTKVKGLLDNSPHEVLEALRTGEVSINRAFEWIRDPPRQLDRLHLWRNLRGVSRTVNSLLSAHLNSEAAEEFDCQRVTAGLSVMNAEQRAAVFVAEVNVPGEVLLISPRLRRALSFQGVPRP